MSKIIGLSGPQGSGKSTLLKGLAAEGVVVDDFKVSREVQKRLGLDSLANAYETAESMMKFQDMILHVKRERELENLERADVDVILTERTFADIAVYTQLWAIKLLGKDAWNYAEAVDYTLRFLRDAGDLQYLYSTNLYLPAMPHVVWEDDKHRAGKEDVESFSEEIQQFFDCWHPADVPVGIIESQTVEDRVRDVKYWINGL